MPVHLSKTILRGFSLIVKLLLVCLEAIRTILDLIDDGIANGSLSLPSWYFDLVNVLNVLQESFDKVNEFTKSEILQKPVEE